MLTMEFLYSTFSFELTLALVLPHCTDYVKAKELGFNTKPNEQPTRCLSQKTLFGTPAPDPPESC